MTSTTHIRWEDALQRRASALPFLRFYQEAGLAPPAPAGRPLTIPPPIPREALETVAAPALAPRRSTVTPPPLPIAARLKALQSEFRAMRA
jgi:hypothetical protein